MNAKGFLRHHGLEHAKSVVINAPKPSLSCPKVAYCDGWHGYRTYRNIGLGELDVDIGELRKIVTNKLGGTALQDFLNDTKHLDICLS